MATSSLQVNQDIILATKRQHIRDRQAHTPTEAVLSLAAMQRRPRNLLNITGDGTQIALIAQVRRQEMYDPVTSALLCEQAGADAIAFYTDHSIYDNDLDDMLMVARAMKETPVIYQNYVFNEYSVMAARGADASALMLYASLMERDTLRKVVSMTQRWKMTAIVQISDLDNLSLVQTLSPHVLALGNMDDDDINDLASQVYNLLPEFPPHTKVMLTPSLVTLDDLDLALQAGVDAVIVDEELLKDERTAADITARITEAEAERRRLLYGD